ncbi:MAG: NifU family protein [Actinomycetota bacterium]|nr:NifU family protein [Actinomycetota bacterium]
MAEQVSERHAAAAPQASLAALGPLLDRLEALLGQVEGMDEQVRDKVFELLDGVDAVHRLAITRLADVVGDGLVSLRCSDVAIDWLFEAYGVGVDDVEAASAALDEVRPYLHEHGGEVQVLGVQQGVVRLRLSGACSGCTSASDTLRHGVEEALREGLPGFVAIDVATDDGAAAHPPPTQVFVQITPRPV